MDTHAYFLQLYVRNQSLFEEAIEAFDEGDEVLAMGLLDRICDKLEIEGDLEELAELTVRGEYDPLS